MKMQVDVIYVFFELWNVHQADVPNQKTSRFALLAVVCGFLSFGRRWGIYASSINLANLSLI